MLAATSGEPMCGASAGVAAPVHEDGEPDLEEQKSLERSQLTASLAVAAAAAREARRSSLMMRLAEPDQATAPPSEWDAERELAGASPLDESQPESDEESLSSSDLEERLLNATTYYCVVPSAPAEQLCKLMSRFLADRGWEPWPYEDWFESSETGEMLSRPAHAQSVDFCNCGSYCLISVDIGAAEWAYDRLMLSDLAPDLCPPSFKIKAGALVGALAAEFDASSESPMWFLKENGRNAGQGIDVVRTAAEALVLAAEREVDTPGREFVLQPHVHRALLYDGKYKFHVRVYALMVVSPMLRYPRCFGYSAAFMHVNPLPWSPTQLEKAVQSVHGRSDRPKSGWDSPKEFRNWEHYDIVEPRLMSTTATLLDRIEQKLGPQSGTNRTAFEILGLDFMIDEDLQPSLLEANTGPVLLEDDEEDMAMVAGIVEILFGTKEAPLGSAEQGSGTVHGKNRWKELNNQYGHGSWASAARSGASEADVPAADKPAATTTRRGLRVTKLVEWLGQLAAHDDLDYLMIEEDLIAYCTAELQAFCGEEDGGLQEVHSAGVVDACESVLRTDDLMDTAFHDTLMLLATLCTDDEILLEISCANLAEALLLHSLGDNQALAGPLCDLVILTAQHLETCRTDPLEGSDSSLTDSLTEAFSGDIEPLEATEVLESQLVALTIA